MLEPLVEHRAAQGLRVRLIDLQDIYDEFAGGMATAQAIHDFLAYAAANWIPPAPAYVLLAGDGTYDPHGYVTSPAAAMLPAYLQFVDPLLGETASDNRLAVFGPEPLPSLAIGRLPARSAAELAVMVDKILGYERAPPEGNWRGRLAFVADNAFAPDGMPDPAGNFWTLSEAIAGDPTLVPPDFVLERFYYNPCDPAQTADCASPARSFADNDALTAGLVAAWNEGLLLVNYVGHGAPASWAGAPTLFSATEATSLTNGDRLPVTLEMTCYTGAFHFPQRETVAEALMRAPQGRRGGCVGLQRRRRGLSTRPAGPRLLAGADVDKCANPGPGHAGGQAPCLGSGWRRLPRDAGHISLVRRPCAAPGFTGHNRHRLLTGS